MKERIIKMKVRHPLFSLLSCYIACDMNAAGRSVGERVCHARAVADDEESGMFRLEIAVDGDLHVVELDFDAVEERVVSGSAGAILSRA